MLENDRFFFRATMVLGAFVVSGIAAVGAGFVFFMVWLVGEVEREQAVFDQCAEEAHPYEWKMIDGVCHRATEDGWERVDLPAEAP